MNKLAYILEVTWLVLSILCLVIALYTVFSPKSENNYMFFLLSIISFLMYQVRKGRRVKRSVS